MAERKQVDWESVERDYSAGLLSLREIADKHGTKESTIRSRAEVNGWSRDLAVKIARKVEDISRKEVSRSTSRSEKDITEREIIETNAQAIVNIKTSHRTDIKRNKDLLESLTKELALIGEQVAINVKIDCVKKLTETLKVLVGLEREAYGITNLEQTQKPIENMTNDELERKIAELVNRSF